MNKLSKKKDTEKELNYMLLFIGIMSIVFGLVLLISSPEIPSPALHYIRPALVFIVGCFLLVRGFAAIRKAWIIFSGMFLTFVAIGMAFFYSGFSPYTLQELWPSLVVLSGLTLIPSGYYKYKTLHAAYIVPSSVLILMGLFFLLFSLNIIEETFLSFATKWWPLLFVFFGCFMIVFFTISQAKRIHELSNANSSDTAKKGEEE